MQQYPFLKVFVDSDIQEYMADVVSSLVSSFGRDLSAVRAAVLHDMVFLESHLAEYPEIMWHEDPMKVAELLAIRWRWTSGRQLQAV